MQPDFTTRPSAAQQLMAVADTVSQRSTCGRLHVGAAASLLGRVIATGYNGAPPGAKHCAHRDNVPCTDSIHAEMNLIGFAARHGIRLEGAQLTVTHQPCLSCAMASYAAGITAVTYREPYRDDSGLRFLKRHGIDIFPLR